jgi:two-component system sensor histidine kinase ChiS
MLAVDMFIGCIAQELRTPLITISAFSNLLLEGASGPITEQQKVDLEAINRSTEALKTLINDLVEVVRIETGLFTGPHFSRVNFRQVVESVMLAARDMVQDKPIRLEQNILDDLPVIWADKARVERVIHELIANAAKFTQQGEIELAITHNDDWLTVKVSDTGAGIPQQVREAFANFGHSIILYRVAAQAGWRLALSRILVEMHKGEIRLESQEGKGTVITFTLPIQLNKPSYETRCEGGRFVVYRQGDGKFYGMYGTLEQANNQITELLK